jgi:hypothetical protein
MTINILAHLCFVKVNIAFDKVSMRIFISLSDLGLVLHPHKDEPRGQPRCNHCTRRSSSAAMSSAELAAVKCVR